MPLEHRFAQEMIAHAREDAPDECCGMLAGSDGRVTQVYRTANAYRSPLRYSISPKDMLAAISDMQAKGCHEMGVYHSHIFSDAYPSQTDVSLALLSGWLGPDFFYFLVSLKDTEKPSLRAYTIEVKDEASLAKLREHLTPLEGVDYPATSEAEPVVTVGRSGADYVFAVLAPPPSTDVISLTRARVMEVELRIA